MCTLPVIPKAISTSKQTEKRRYKISLNSGFPTAFPGIRISVHRFKIYTENFSRKKSYVPRSAFNMETAYPTQILFSRMIFRWQVFRAVTTSVSVVGKMHDIITACVSWCKYKLLSNVLFHKIRLTLTCGRRSNLLSEKQAQKEIQKIWRHLALLLGRSATRMLTTSDGYSGLCTRKIKCDI